MCSLAGVPYHRQLADKQQRIANLFEDVAGPSCVLEPIAGMADPYRFRCKIASPFAPGTTKGHRGRSAARDRILCGMYAPGSHRIIQVPTCPVEHEVGRQVVQSVRQIMLRHGMAPYNEDSAIGFVRHVLVRVGYATGEVLVTIVTASREFPGAKSFARELVHTCPQVTTVVQNVNARATNAILGGEEHTLYGPGFILDHLCGLSFRISSRSFYQVNPAQAQVLYEKAVGCASMFKGDASEGDAPAGGASAGDTSAGGASAGDTSVKDDTGSGPLVVDAYCGTGTIGLVAASRMPDVRVVGVDKVDSAIRDARQNAVHNGIANADFIVDDAGTYLCDLAARGVCPNVLFLDPPRAGASEQFLQAALRAHPSRIVYISCNPQTQVRDVQVLVQGGYELRSLHPVDMFPHTSHVECVALMVPTDR